MDASGTPAAPRPPVPPAVPAPPEPSGPPPTPFERRRRHRRRLVASMAAFALVVSGIVLVAVTRGLPQDAPDAAGDDGAATAPTPVPEDEEGGGGDRASELERPDLDGLDGADLALARVLVEVDESELVMLRYDDELFALFSSPDATAEDLGPLLADVSAAARRGEEALGEIALRLRDPLDDEAAEAVRAAYLPHLEAWRTSMANVAAQPSRLLVEGAGDADTLDINVTADAFRRALEAVLAGDVDRDVATFGEGILDRGFRGADVPSDAAWRSRRAVGRESAA